jgi:bacterioferritin
MSANTTVLANLQTAVSMEIAAVHQYLMHAHVLDDWGLTKLGAKMRGEMAEELGHAGAFMQRITFLKGSPEVDAAQTPHRAQDLSDMFEADLRDETASIEFYTEAARAAGDAGDIGTRSLFEKIVLDEEGHKAWLELQMSLIKRMGEPAYFAMEIGSHGSE